MSHPARMLQNFSGRSLFLGVLFALIWAGPGSSRAFAREQASSDAEAVVTLWVSDEAVDGASGAAEKAPDRGASTALEGEESAQKRQKIEKISELAAQRLRARLKAARLKDASVTADGSRTIVVRARGGVDRDLIAGIVVPQGHFELRPVMQVGDHWLKVLARLPAGVTLRQDRSSLEAKDAYLWSKNRAALQTAVTIASAQFVQYEGFKVALYPADGGWRTLALDRPVATQQDITEATIRQGKTGETYVRLRFRRDLGAAARQNQVVSGRAQRWAVLLDGEVVSVLLRNAEGLGNALSVTAPGQLSSRQARYAWAQQVAGRLAAFMPIPLVEAGGLTPAK